ncbi:hypothetical protein MTO96_026528 [Rhipicephalus appendiculatus]
MVHARPPSAVRVGDAVKTATPPRVEVKQRRKTEERVAEAKPSASTQAGVAPSSEALGTSAVASGRASGVHKRRSKKHRTSKSLAGAAVETSAERVFDEAVAVHGHHHHHHRRRHSKSKKHAKKGDGKRHSRKTKKEPAVDSTTQATQGELPPASTTDVYADGGPSKVEGSDTATTAFKEPSAVSAPSKPFYVLPPTADVTLTGTDTGQLLGGQRHQPRSSTVIRGDDVTVHVDLTSRERAAMFWPFGHRGHKKKQTKQP